MFKLNIKQNLLKYQLCESPFWLTKWQTGNNSAVIATLYKGILLNIKDKINYFKDGILAGNKIRFDIEVF